MKIMLNTIHVWSMIFTVIFFLFIFCYSLFTFLTNIFATKSLKIKNLSKEDIEYKLKDCFIRSKDTENYSGKVRAGNTVSITNEKVVLAKDLIVSLVSDKSKTKSFGVLNFPDKANRVLEINYIPESRDSQETSADKEGQKKSFWNRMASYKEKMSKKVETGFSLNFRSK